MCGRFTQTKTREEVLKQLGDIELPPLFHRRYNVAPTQQVAVIKQQSPNRAEACFWGFENPKTGAPIINARAESLTDRPLFRPLLFTHRCLIPADGFYEWKDRTPYYFQTPQQTLFAFAGLWNRGRCVIITRPADQQMQGLHDRMPVIIPPEQWNTWLLVPEHGKVHSAIVRLELPEKPQPLTARPVSKRVNKVSFDDPACLDPGEIQSELF